MHSRGPWSCLTGDKLVDAADLWDHGSIAGPHKSHETEAVDDRCVFHTNGDSEVNSTTVDSDGSFNVDGKMSRLCFSPCVCYRCTLLVEVLNSFVDILTNHMCSNWGGGRGGSA